MKYIRTKDKVYEELDYISNARVKIEKEYCLKSANAIEDLCDELVVVQKDFHDLLDANSHCLQTMKRYCEINKIEVLGIYGAIWTEWGLKYVAKMNEKGELELLWVKN